MQAIKTEPEPIQIAEHSLVYKWTRLKTSAGFGNNDEFCNYLLDQEEIRQSGFYPGYHQEELNDSQSLANEDEENAHNSDAASVDQELEEIALSTDPVVRYLSLLKPQSKDNVEPEAPDDSAEVRPLSPPVIETLTSSRPAEAPGSRSVVHVKRTTSLLKAKENSENEAIDKLEQERLKQIAELDLSTVQIKPISELLKKLAASAPVSDSNNGRKTKGHLTHTSLLGNNSKMIIEKQGVFMCERCDEVFIYASEREIHMRGHFRIAPLLCKKCGNKFQTRIQLTQHELDGSCVPKIRTEPPEKKKKTPVVDPDKPEMPERVKSISCVCGKRFYTRNGLKKHKINRKCKLTRTRLKRPKILIKNRQCSICYQKFDYAVEEKLHFKEHHPDQLTEACAATYPCNSCDKVFWAAGRLDAHINRVHLKVKPYACHMCVNQYASKQSLRAHHIETGHYEPGEGPTKRKSPIVNAFLCHICNRGFRSMDGVNKHIKTQHNRTKPPRQKKPEGVGTGPFFCHVCGKVFNSYSNFRRHMEIQHEEGVRKKFLCDKCHETFNSKNGLERHVQMVHVRVKDHHCEMCYGSYYTKQDLKHHIQMTHYNQTLPQYRCNQCVGRFMTGLERDSHIALGLHQHPPIKSYSHRPVPCPLCDKMVSRRHLKKHIDNHTGDNRKACPLCPMTMATNASLRRHLAFTHGEGELPLVNCDHCGMKFRNTSQLRYHLYKAHRDQSTGNQSLHQWVQQQFPAAPEPVRAKKRHLLYH